MASFVEEEIGSNYKVQSGHRRRELVRYLALYIALPLFLYLLPLAFVRTAAFIRWGGSEYTPALEYIFSAPKQHADVVIYGDSSAFYGISPSQMSHELGMKVINLPNTGYSLPVLNDLPLRFYLSVNPPPKLIVFYLAPWDLNFTHKDNGALYEGEQVLLRHGTTHEIEAFALRHPIDLLEYPFQVYSTGPKTALFAAIHHAKVFRGVDPNGGHLETGAMAGEGAAGPVALTPACVIPSRLLDEGFESVQSLRTKYATGDTQVLVVLAPMPSCEGASGIAARDYDKIPAARPRLLPPDYFRDDKNYIHPVASVVPLTTTALTAAVKQALAKSTH